MKYLPLLLIAVSVIACKNFYHEKKDCAFVVPPGFELVINKDSLYAIKVIGGYTTDQYLGSDFPGSGRIREWYAFPEEIDRFKDSCEAKGLLARYLKTELWIDSNVEKIKNEFKPVIK